jgi:hypothetical protein
MSAQPYAGLLEQLNASAKDFELPPSIQSMRNIRAIDAMNEAAEAISSLLNLLREARGAMLGVTDHYCRLVDSGEAGFWNPNKESEVVAARYVIGNIDAALNSDASTQTVGGEN